MKSMLVLGLFRTDLSGLHWKRCVCVRVLGHAPALPAGPSCDFSDALDVPDFALGFNTRHPTLW